MKKNVKGVIAGVAALAVLGGAYAAVMLMDKGGDANSSSSSISSETEDAAAELYSYTAADIASIDVSNANGKYTVVRDKINDDGSATFTIKGFEDLNVNTSLVSSLANNASAMTASIIEKDPQDLSKYGLDKPTADVTVKFDDGEKHFYIGNQSPVSENTYFMIDGDTTVYTVATTSLTVFTSEPTYFLSTTVLEGSTDSSGKSTDPEVEKLTIKRKDLDYDMVLEYDSNSDDEEENTNTSGTLAHHYMTSPIFAYLDVEKSTDTIKSMFGLTADMVMTAHPTDEEKAAAGMNDPFCVVTMETKDGDSYKLTLGTSYEANDTTYYMAYFEGTDVIYAIDVKNLCWTTVKPDDIMSRMVFGTYVWDVGELSITADGATTTFDGKGTSGDDFVVTKDGKKCDTERFRSFYTYILKTAAEEFAMDDKAEGDPSCTVKLKSQDGKTDQTVEFYNQGKQSLIVVNGQPSFKCRTAYVDLLLENLNKFDGDQDFVMNW